jgi:DNA mismatch repair protein MSH5
MPLSFKRKRQSSASSITSRTSRPSSSRLSTPLVSFKRPSLTSQPQPQRKRVAINSQPLPQRAASTSQGPLPHDDEQSAVADEDDTDEVLDNVVMAIDMKERGTVGCAYYVAREERLFCLEDIVNGGNDVVETCN